MNFPLQKFCSTVAVLAFVAISSSSAKVEAAFTLDFGQMGAPGINTFFANPGETLELEIYLVEFDDGTPAVALDQLQTRGLGGFQFNLNLSGNGSVFVSDPPVFTPDPNFDNFSDANFQNPQSATYSGAPPLDPNSIFGDVIPVQSLVGVNHLRLGTIGISIGPTAAGSYDLTVAPLDLFSFFLGADSLDPTSEMVPNPGFAVLNVSAIPEPSSLAVLGVAAAGWIARRRRQRS